MRADEFITEKKKRKRSRWAAYGPGLYGGYGYYAGYSGEGGGDGVGEQTSQSSVSKDDPYNPKKVRPLKDISDDEIRQWLTPDAPSKPDQSKQIQSGQSAKVREASYPGNIGVMEVYKFLKLATPEQVKIFKKLIDDKQFKTAWVLIQGVTGIKLQGDEFNEDNLNIVGNKNTLLDALQDFLPFAVRELKLNSLPKIKLRKHIPDEDQPTFGRFENDSRIINLGIQDRHPIDILRTLAHELVHYKQLLKNGLEKDSGETGSYDENQANSLAGIIMRKFNKKFPEYFNSSAVSFNENFADGHNLHEKVQDYLWHGSREEHNVLYPRQAVDTGGAEGSNKNAVYATPNAKVAIAMGLTTPGSDTGMFPDDPQMVLFKGEIRKGDYVYLHKVPKDLFIKHNSREWYSKPDVKEITPIEIKAIPVNKWLHLIRQATPQDLELQKKYMKENFINEDSQDQNIVTRIDSKPIKDFATNLKAYKHTDDWSQSGIDTGDDSYWKKKNLKVNTTKGLYAGDPQRTALYATGNAHETRYVEFKLDGQPIVYFDKKDLPKIRSRKTYLSVFDASNFKKLPTGEYFSDNPGEPLKQTEIKDPFQYIASQGWIIRTTDNIEKVFDQVKNMHKAGKIPHYGAEGMDESVGVAENFADGRNPQDKGDSKRHGITKGMSISQLKKIRGSKTASPRKKQLAHWQINMRQGRKK